MMKGINMEKEVNSLEAFKGFLFTLPMLGGVGANTLKNMKTVPRMLEYVPSETEDFKLINVDETVDAYLQGTGAQIGNASKSSYKSRINQAIRLYTAFLNDPNSIKSPEESAMPKAENPKPQVNATHANTIDIPVPIRDGLILMIPGVPTDLTNEEAERIASILKVYARPQ